MSYKRLRPVPHRSSPYAGWRLIPLVSRRRYMKRLRAGTMLPAWAQLLHSWQRRSRPRTPHTTSPRHQTRRDTHDTIGRKASRLTRKYGAADRRLAQRQCQNPDNY